MRERERVSVKDCGRRTRMINENNGEEKRKMKREEKRRVRES